MDHREKNLNDWQQLLLLKEQNLNEYQNNLYLYKKTLHIEKEKQQFYHCNCCQFIAVFRNVDNLKFLPFYTEHTEHTVNTYKKLCKLEVFMYNFI